MLLRYFATADEQSEIGALSLAYADIFSAMRLPMRIIGTEMTALGGPTLSGGFVRSRWDRHQGSFTTPIEGPYTNVVCGPARYWHRLYTMGVRNVLIVSASSFAASDAKERKAASLYAAVIAPDEVTAEALRAVGANASVVPVSLASSAQALTEALYDVLH